MKRLRIHTNATMEGRIFIQFVSLILTTYLNGVMEKNGWTRNHNLQEIFSEMKSLKQVEVEGKRKKLVTTPKAIDCVRDAYNAQEIILDANDLVPDYATGKPASFCVADWIDPGEIQEMDADFTL